MMAIPSIMGLMLGSLVGVRLLAHAKPKFVRYMVIVVLFFSGVRALMKGLGWLKERRVLWLSTTQISLTTAGAPK